MPSPLQRRRLALAAGALLLLGVAQRERPPLTIKIFTHQAPALGANRMEAAVDLGIVGVSFLYSWTAGRLLR